MPSPGRRVAPSPPRISRMSPSYHHRQRSPDRRRLVLPRPDGASRMSPSRPRERRRSPEHTSSRNPVDTRSRPRESRETLPPKRSSLPDATDHSGRSFSASISSKRKASPKRERDMMRPLDRVESSGGSRLPVPPRKMMRSTSPDLPLAREIPLLGPEIVSLPSRGYSSAGLISTRHYTGSSEVKQLAQSYTITAPPATGRYSGDVSPPPRYSNPSRSYAEPVVAVEPRGYAPASKLSAARGYAGSSTFRRSASEEGLSDLDRTSAQKRATVHMTSSRFGDMRDMEEASLMRSDKIDINPASLSGYVFNINNEPNPKYNRDHNVVRKIVNPESLQVVRRPALRSGTVSYNDQMDWDNEEEEVYRPTVARRAQTSRNGEGQRPIFERDEIVHQQRAVADEGHSRHRDRSPVQQVARYVSPEPYREPPHSRNSRNGQSQVQSRSSRTIPTSSRPAATSTGAYYTEESDRDYRPRDYTRGEPRDSFEHREPSRSVRHEDRDDLRHELELKRVVRPSPERARDSTRRREGERSRDIVRARDSRAGSESDLRVQINEKRTTHSTERYERQRPSERRERPSERSHDRERRHSPSGDRRRHSDSHERRERSHRETSPQYRDQPKPWEVDPEIVPRGKAYFEHDNREEMQMMRGRGNMRMRPGFVYLGRGMRRPYRGAPFGGFVMGRGPPRGFPPPRGFVAFGPPRPYAGMPVRWPYQPYAVMPPRRPPPAPVTPRPTANVSISTVAPILPSPTKVAAANETKTDS